MNFVDIVKFGEIFFYLVFCKNILGKRIVDIFELGIGIGTNSFNDRFFNVDIS